MQVQKLVFSSRRAADGTVEGRRYSRWFDEYRATIGGREVILDHGIPFAARVEYRALGAVGLGRSVGTTLRLERRPEHVARDGDDRFMLVLNRSAAASEGSNDSRSMTVAPGAATLLDFARPSVHAYPAGYRSITLHLPRHQMIEAVPHVENLAGTALAAGGEALRLLAAYADTVLDDEGLSDPAVLAHAGRSLLDLAALACGAERDRAELACTRGQRAARLAQVLGLIRAEFTDPEISPDRVAGEIGITTRYLHKLLHETGSSFAVRVQELRLARSFMLLSMEEGRLRKIGDVAYAVGFNDLSHFNRLFRRKYGLTPSAARGRGRPG